MRIIYMVLLSALFTFAGHSQNDIRISGRITDGKNPIQDVSIQIPGTETGTFSDSEGRYQIRVPFRKTVLFTYTGMTTIEYIVEDVDAVVNLEMYPDVQYLDEVVVQKRRKTQKDLEKEYPTNKRIIKTGFGYVDQDKVGYTIRVFDGEKLSRAGIDFVGSLQSFVPGMQVIRPNGVSRGNFRFGTDATRPLVFLPRRFMSFQNTRPVAYEVDGQLMTGAPIELQMFNIERIAVLSSVSALSKYGTLAAGGLIIINTKGGVFDVRSRSANRFDQARSWDNIFEKEKLGRLSHIPVNRTLEDFQNIDNKEDALSFVEDGKLLSSLSVYNQIEVADLFLDRWRDEMYYLKIMNGIAQENFDNSVILKSLAFLYEENGFLEESLGLYKQVLKLRPDYAQSYRDLSSAYSKLGDTQKSIDYLGRYIRFVSLDTLSTPAQGIDSLIFTEYDNLLARSGVKRYDKRIADPEKRGSVRLVFEWTHGDSEFELQFVNPSQRYFTWQHLMKETPERIKDEKLKGYSSEQFFVDGTMPGRWQVNMKYLGNKSFDPTYLRTTVYYNYGTPFESRETTVHKLTAKNVNYELFNFINRPIVSAASR